MHASPVLKEKNSVQKLKTGLLQEDKSLLVAIESIEDYEIPEGAAPIARKTKKRHRADVMPGSSIRFEAMPPAEGESRCTFQL